MLKVIIELNDVAVLKAIVELKDVVMLLAIIVLTAILFNSLLSKIFQFTTAIIRFYHMMVLRAFLSLYIYMCML